MIIQKDCYYQMGIHKRLIYETNGILCSCGNDFLTVGNSVLCFNCFEKLVKNIIEGYNNYINEFAYFYKIETMKKNSFLPKDLIFDAIIDRLEQSDIKIENIVMIFSLNGNEHNILVKFENKENITKYNLENKDISLIKKMFINKIIKLIDKKNYKDIILKIHILKREFSIFLQDNENEIVPFNY